VNHTKDARATTKLAHYPSLPKPRVAGHGSRLGKDAGELQPGTPARLQRRWIDNAGKRRITSICRSAWPPRPEKMYVYCSSLII